MESSVDEHKFLSEDTNTTRAQNLQSVHVLSSSSACFTRESLWRQHKTMISTSQTDFCTQCRSAGRQASAAQSQEPGLAVSDLVPSRKKECSL